jgi:hypothetical protein
LAVAINLLVVVGSLVLGCRSQVDSIMTALSRILGNKELQAREDVVFRAQVHFVASLKRGTTTRIQRRESVYRSCHEIYWLMVGLASCIVKPR